MGAKNVAGKILFRFLNLKDQNIAVEVYLPSGRDPGPTGRFADSPYGLIHAGIGGHMSRNQLGEFRQLRNEVTLRGRLTVRCTLDN